MAIVSCLVDTNILLRIARRTDPVFQPLVMTHFRGSADNRSGDALKRAPTRRYRDALLLWKGSRQKRNDIGPLPLAFGELAKGMRQRLPASESPCEGERIVFPRKAIGPPRGHGALFSDHLTPVFEQFTVLRPRIQPIRLESRGPHGLIPFREESEEGIPGEFCAGGEFQDRGRVAELSRDRGDGL